jgi:hypothetical protein
LTSVISSYIRVIMKVNKGRIKYELAKRKWSMNRFALELGVTRQGLHYMLHTRPTITRVERFAEILGVPFMELITIIDKEAA